MTCLSERCLPAPVPPPVPTLKATGAVDGTGVPVVLTERVGKKRPFLRGLVLTLLTFGLYAFYWRYMALQEVYRQFELLYQGRDDGVVWLVLGLVIPVFNLVYFWTAVSNVRYVRHRMGRDPGVGPRRFVALYVASQLLVFATLVTAVVASSRGLASGFGLYALVALGGLVAYGILAAAYRELQGDINGIWDAWEERVDEVTGPGPEAPGPGRRVPASGPGPSSEPGGTTG